MYVEYNALPCISSKLIYIYNSVLYSVCVMYLKIYRYHMFKQWKATNFQRKIIAF